MSRDYDNELWGFIDQAAIAYECDESELAAWAARGDVRAYHLRGPDGGWLFQLGQIPDVFRLRQAEKAIEESRNALQLSLPIPLDEPGGYFGPRGNSK